MEKAQKVINAYLLMNKLKDVIRTGWKNWNVTRERIESIAEHIYGVQQLALIMHQTYEKNENIDIFKVIMMLAIHETEEAYIGDLTLFDISREEKAKLGHEKVHEFFSQFMDGQEFENLILEFDERKTEEAKFAYYCDKLECDIQAWKYDGENCVALNNQENNKSFHDKKVQELLNQGLSFGEMWIQFGQDRYNYDKPFLEVSNYIKHININQIKVRINLTFLLYQFKFFKNSTIAK